MVKNEKNESVISSRNIASEILEEFERLLDEHDIYIPSDDRNGDEGEACLYGLPYWNLLDDVEDIVYSALKVMKEKHELDIVKGVLY